MKSLISSGMTGFHKVLFGVITAWCLILLQGWQQPASGADQADISAHISANYTTVTTSYNPLSKTYTASHNVTLKNTSSFTFALPLHGVLLFNNLTGTVTVPGALGGPGVAPYQQFYYDLTSKLAGGSFPPGASLSFKVSIQRKSGTSYSSTIVKPYGVLPALNQPPVASAGSNQTITLNFGETTRAVTLTGSGTDSDGSIASWLWSGTPAPSPANAAITTVNLGAGTHAFTLTITDDKGVTSSATTTVTINPAPNQPPTANAGQNQTITLNSGETSHLVTLSGSGSDPENGQLTYAWSGTPKPADIASPGVNLGVGTYPFSLIVTDDKSAMSAPATVTITVNAPVNRSPVLDPIGAKTVAEGQFLSFTVSGSDPDGNVLTFTTGPLPAGAGFNAATRTFSWTPDYTQAGIYPVTVTVSDGSFSASEIIMITVSNSNLKPLLGPVPAKTVAENATLAFTLTASDPDGDSITFSSSNLPAGATLNPATGAFAWTPSYTQAGNYKQTFTVSDGVDMAAQDADITVTDVNRGPAITSTTIPAPRINTPYAGTVAAVDPDNDPLTYTLGSGVPTGMTIAAGTGVLVWTPAIREIGKSYTFTVTVDDGRGGSDSREYTLTIADTIPPAVQLNAPKEAIPGATFVVSATATDNIEVVNLSIDTGAATCTTVASCQSIVTMDQVLAPGSIVSIIATASDAAGNTRIARAEVRVTAVTDTEPPITALSAPLSVTAGQIIKLSASAADNQGVANLAFATGTIAIGNSVPPVDSMIYTIPADAVVGTNIQFSVIATDFSGLTASATAESIVVGTSDTTPPVIILSVPLTVVAGRNLPVSLKVTDDRGVANVDLLQAHQKVSSFPIAIDQTISLPVPVGTEAGTRLVIEVVATDASGNSSRASATSIVEVLQGLVTGAVYDDTTGVPLPGAVVTLVIAGRLDLTALTDARGHYSFVTDEGSGLLTVTKSGYSRVDRPGTAIVINAGRRVFDTRLTPLSTKPVQVTSILGGSVSAPFSASGGGMTSGLSSGNGSVHSPATLSVPAGALTADSAVTLTQTGAQGLQGRLPTGWSPAAALDIDPHGLAFAKAASLTLPNFLGLPASAAYPIVRWDVAVGKWTGAGTAVVSSDAASLTGWVAVSGQFAVLVADAGSQLQGPADGAPLSGLSLVPVAQDATALVLPNPKLIFYRPGVKSEVSDKFTSQTALPSGTSIWANIEENYNFYTGQQMTGEPFFQDIVLYSFGRQNGALAADHFVSPTLDFAGLALEKGIITVTAAVPRADGDVVSVAGVAGGDFTAAGGETLTVPAGAINRFTPIFIKSIPRVEDTGITLPTGIRFVGGITLGLGGQEFNLSALLSLPLPFNFTPTGDLALVKTFEVNGETRLIYLAAAAVENGRIVTKIDLLGDGAVRGPGITGDGRYLILDTGLVFGFAGGLVSGIDALSFAGALVSGDVQPLNALSSKSGRYVIPVVAGPFILTALDPVKRDQGSFAGAGTVRAFTPVDLSLKIEPPTVVAVLPAAGASTVPLADPVRVTFSEPIDSASLSSLNFSLSAGTSGVLCSLELSAGNTVVTMRHGDPLAPATVYTLTVQNVRDMAGYAMSAPFTSSFTSLDTNPPPPPPAANLTASIPGSDNTTTVTGTQGTAGLHDTAYVVNLTTGARNQVQIDPNGGFTATVAASVKDLLQVEITNPGGGTTTVAVPRFRGNNADGSVSEVVGSEGGVVKGPEGLEITVPENAFAFPTVITVKPVTEANFPVQLTEEAREVYSFTAGVELDFGGAEPAKYLDVSIPPKGGETRLDQWVLAQVAYHDGLTSLNIVDTAHFFGDRIATSSPPCPGVTGRGIYGFLRTNRQVGISYGAFNNAVYGGMVAEVQTVADFIMVMPTVASNYGEASRNFTRFCLPILTGRVNVIPNSHALTFQSSDLNANVSEIIIRNTTLDSEQHFPRNIIEMSFEMDGKGTDLYEVELHGGSSGSPSLYQYFKVYETTVAGKVSIRFSPEKFSGTIEEVTIRNKSKNPVVERVFPVSDVISSLTVEGGISDTVTVTLVDYLGVQQTFTNFIRTALTTAASGNGNLILRVQTGTIDPTQAEINEFNNNLPNYNLDHPATPLSPITGAAVTALELSSSTGAVTPIDIAELKQGGLAVSFDGDRSAKYFLRVIYADGKVDGLPILQFRIVVKNPQTGKVLRTIADQSPLRGEPLNLGIIGNASSNDPPQLTMVPARFRDYDPSLPISFTFSQELDQATVTSGFTVTMFEETGSTVTVTGTITFSNGGKTVTFVPDHNLKLGTRYKIKIDGIKNLSGKVMPNETFYISTLKPKRVCPATGPADCVRTLELGNDGRKLEPLWDVVFKSKRQAGQLQTTVFATGSAMTGYRLLTFDVTNPLAPAEIGHAYGGYYKRRLTLLQDVNLEVRQAPVSGLCGIAAGSTNFTGDLIAASSSNLQSGYVSFFDVTDPNNPCILGSKLLTANPDTLSDYNRQGTIKAQVVNAKGITAIKHSTGYAAYAAFTGVGLMAMDIGKNIPEYKPGFRVKEGLFSGDFQDVINHRDTLLAVDSSANTLYRLDANLAPMTSFILGSDFFPRRLVVSEVSYDRNNNRLFEPDEFIDVAFVAGNGGIAKINVTDQSVFDAFPGTITMPGFARELDYDKLGKRLFVGGHKSNTWAGGDALYLIDVSDPSQAGTVTNTISADSPMMWKTDFPSGINGFKFDSNRGLAYIATPEGLDIWSFVGACSDISVLMTRKSEELRAKAELLEMEREALRKGIMAAMNALSLPTSNGGCDIAGAPLSLGITILEQGSGACIWKKGDDCRNFQPQISDHDFEVFIPAALQSKAECITNLMKDQFIDKNTDLSKKFVLTNGEVEFDDITFFAFPKDEFESAQPNIISPAAGGTSAGSDAIGDAGLGRRQLLLKWVLEGAYIIPATADMDPGLDGVKGTPDDKNPLAGKNLELIRSLLTTNKIPLLEGYEQALLQQFNLAKAKVFVRLVGSSAPESVLHTTFQKQLHDAAKAGIRSAMGRLITDAATNRAMLSATRDGFESDACIEDPARPEPEWRTSRCDSFEHLIASVVLRTKPASFSADELDSVARFYRIKSDLETITTENDANNFILKAHKFIEQSLVVALPTFNNDISTDPQAVTRQQNVDAIGTESSGLLKDKLKNAKIQVIPNFNNQGFIEGADLMISMYEGTVAGLGTLKKTISATLSGGDYRFADYVRTDYFGGQVLLAGGKKQPVFQVGPVDMTDTSQQPEGIAFVIDLPTTGYQKVLKEAYLQNNYDGFYYYVLPRNATAGSFTPPSVSGKPPLPIPDPNGTLLTADPFCQESASDLEFYMTVNGEKQITLGVDKEVTLGYRVRNTGTKIIKNIRVVRNGQTVAIVASLSPGDEVLQSESFTPTEPIQYVPLASAVGEVQNADGQPEYSAGPKISSVVINANDLNEPFKVKLFDASKLNEIGHPLSRWTLMHDANAADKEIVGAVTDGDSSGGGSRVRIEIEGLKPGTDAKVSIQDGELDNVTDGVGTIYTGSFQADKYSVTVTPDILGKATVYYTPPGYFERKSYKKEDTNWPASYFKAERDVRVTVKQMRIGRTVKMIKLRRPPVFLIHGLWGERTTWNDYQPLVPESGVGDYYKPFKGFDGRFDIFAIGTAFASKTYEKLVAEIINDINVSLTHYLKGYSIGKFDVIGHSLGGVLARKMTNINPQMRAAVRKLISNGSPFKGSEIADELIKIRERAIFKTPETADQPKMLDVINPSRGKIFSPEFNAAEAAKASVDLCALAVQSLGFTNRFSMENGALEDLKTTSFEVAQMNGSPIHVPSHSITGWTISNPIMIGMHYEVKGVWAALSGLCELTADEDTKTLTQVYKDAFEITKVLASFGLGAAKATGYVSSAVQGGVRTSATSIAMKKEALKALEDLNKYRFEQMTGDGYRPVFGTSPNDRIVKVDSQRGNIPTSGYAYTDLYGKTDHQQMKTSPIISWGSCLTVDSTLNVPMFMNAGPSPPDLNFDGSPDVACRVVDLLEADPSSRLFFKGN